MMMTLLPLLIHFDLARQVCPSDDAMVCCRMERAEEDDKDTKSLPTLARLFLKISFSCIAYCIFLRGAQGSKTLLCSEVGHDIYQQTICFI